MPTPVRVIVNPSAGGGRAGRLLPGVEAALRSLGRPFSVHHTTSLDHARALARAATAAGEVAAAMGGDGLVGAVAGELRGTDGVLAVLPGGRGNDFARKLGLGGDPAKACELAFGDGVAPRLVDVADADGAAYLGIASAGIDSDVQDIANATRLPLGGQVYTYGALRALASWRDCDWTVAVDGEERRFRGYSVAVCNSGVFGGGMFLVPGASLDDGLLDVVLTGSGSKGQFIRGLGQVRKGTHLQNENLTVLRGREVSFRADRPFRVYADGDPIAALPVTIRVQPAALRVLAPA